jgi:anti-sigma B factor antagonist
MDHAGDDLLSVRREVNDRAVMIHAVGEVDHATASRLSAELTNAVRDTTPTQVIVLDLNGISFLGSAGLAVLVEHHRHSQRNGRDLRIVVSNTMVRRSLQRTGLIQLLQVHDTLGETH